MTNNPIPRSVAAYSPTSTPRGEEEGRRVGLRWRGVFAAERHQECRAKDEGEGRSVHVPSSRLTTGERLHLVAAPRERTAQSDISLLGLASPRERPLGDLIDSFRQRPVEKPMAQPGVENDLAGDQLGGDSGSFFQGGHGPPESSLASRTDSRCPLPVPLPPGEEEEPARRPGPPGPTFSRWTDDGPSSSRFHRRPSSTRSHRRKRPPSAGELAHCREEPR